MFTYNKYVVIDTFYFMFNWLTNTMGWPLERYHNQFLHKFLWSISSTLLVSQGYTHCPQLTSKRPQEKMHGYRIWQSLGTLQKACTNQEWRIHPVLMIQLLYCHNIFHCN